MLARRIERWLLTACLVLGVAERLCAEPVKESSAQPILSDADLWNLSAAERALPHPIRMEIRINFFDPVWHNIWYEDKAGPGYFYLSAKPPLLKADQRVLLEGTLIPSIGLEASRLTVTNLGKLDESEGISVKGRFGDMPTLDRHRVTVDALVDRMQWIDDHHMRLSLIVEGRPAIGWVFTEPGQKLPDWSDRFVRMNAVYSGRSDLSTTQPEIELWTAHPGEIHVLYPISAAPMFDISTTPIARLLNAPFDHLVRIRGRMESQEPGETLSIRDETGQVRVQTTQEERFPGGTWLEAVGLPAISGRALVLRSGVVRRATAPESDLAKDEKNRVLNFVGDVRHLTPEEAASGRKVSLRGVVSWALPDLPYLFIQDLSGGVRVRFNPALIAPQFIGRHVIVEGYTVAADPSPVVEASRIIYVRSMGMPEPIVVTWEQAMTGSAEAQWVEVHGYLRNAEVVGGRTQMKIITPGGEFSAVVQTPEHIERMVNALIRMRGVCETILDENKRIAGVKLWIPYLHNIRVEEEAPADVFDSPLRSIASIRQLSATPEITRTRVSGVVLYQEPGRSIFFQQDNLGLLILSQGTLLVSPGDRIEAVGLIGREGSRTLLRDALFRVTGSEAQPTPIVLESPEKVNESWDGRLVKVRGTLVNQLKRPERTRLTLQRGETLFEAIVDHTDGRDGPLDIPLETGLELTGIYRVVLDDSRQSRGFQLLVRTPRDLSVYRKARLWTAQRGVAAAGILGSCLLLGVVWVTALRRRLRRQTAQIRTQVQKEVVLEARHRGIVENASDFIFMIDLEGRFTSFNPAGERMTGYSRAEAMTMNIRQIFEPEQAKEVRSKLDFVPAGDGTVTFQSQLRMKDGKLIWIETSSRLIRDEGATLGVLGIVRDISERKLIEEELKRARDAAEANTRAKSEFLANMSHEIRTPMNAVIGMSNLLLDTRLDERQRDFAETIRNGAEALLTVLNDILDFSKMEAGKLQIEEFDFDLRETVDATVELLAARAATKGLELTAFVPARIPSALRGDPSRLRQVLLNMLGNALKFTEHGEVILQVSVESENEQDAHFLFEIIDTGVGISAEEQSGLFRPFTQADNSTTRRFGGTGLGLAISKQIVELLSGRCGVRSEVGEGSTFWFTAKFAKQKDPHPVAKLDPSKLALAGTRVLLVDDSTTACRLLDHYASGWGMRASDTMSGAEALFALRTAAAAEEPFQVALIDAQLPDMDGLSLARSIRNDPSIGTLRIVFLNSLQRAIMPAEMVAIGLSTSLLKPIRQSELLSALARVLPTAQNASLVGTGSRLGSTVNLAHSAITAPPASAPPISLRVLLAEDNLVNQRVALLQLQKLGHRTQAASNGLDVLMEIERAEYDVILMDCHMPEMDGFEATRKIRQHPQYSKVRIIALTANAMQGDREKCLAAGMDDYLSKPVRIPELQAALARCYPANSL